MTSRRALLATIPALALAACATNGAPSQTPAQVIADLQIIANALINDAVVLTGLPPDKAKIVRTAVDNIAIIAGKVAQGVQDGASGVQEVYAALQTIIDASAPYTALLPKQWVDAIAAAQTLLPVLALLVGVSLPAPPAQLGRTTPAAARAALAQHAGRQ